MDTIAKPLSKFCGVFHAEVVAITEATSKLKQTGSSKTVHVYTDSHVPILAQEIQEQAVTTSNIVRQLQS